MKNKKIGRSILFGISITLLILLVITLILFWNELRSLASLKKIDDYGMYQMVYYGDYGFDDFLEVGATGDTDIRKIICRMDSVLIVS